MLIGVPKEIKNHEYRVGLVPYSVKECIANGHSVIVQKGAGLGIGMSDDDYRTAGAAIIDTAEEIFARADLIVKVKEPQPNECKMLRFDQVLFTYLHLASDLEQTKALLKSGCTAVAYETVTDVDCGLPLLAPMSEVAGRLAITAGAHCLEKAQGGKGVLLGGVPGVSAAKVTVIGGGVVGTESIRMAIGLGARVTVLECSLKRLRELEFAFGPRINAVFSQKSSIEKYVTEADLVVGAVLLPGAAAPKLVTKQMISAMKPGSVVVDVAIDQGGCFETSHATTHADPTYVVDGVVHYCVANMPGAVPRTSAFALNNATLPFTLKLANLGFKKALLCDKHFLPGLNIYKGMLTCSGVCEAFGMSFVAPKEALDK